MTQVNLPSDARAVVIGGGVAGCSVAYHLADLGWEDVVLLERKDLTSGSTFHAAGLVGQLRSSASITQLLKYSVELYDRLAEESGQATGWNGCGGLRLACNEERWTEVRRQATTAHSFGLEMHLLSPAEAKKLWPLMDVSDLVGAAFLPTDGSVQPSDVTQALAKAARAKGVRMVEDCKVEGILTDKGRVAGVETNRGTIRSAVVVNCAGIWARRVGELAGVSVPVQPVAHQYMITEPLEGVTQNLPTLRDPDNLVYFKEEVGGLVLGGYELNPIPFSLDIPPGFHFQLLEPDWDHFMPLAEAGFGRVPGLENVPVRKLVNGPEAFTPDGNFILGEAPELRGFFVCAGFNAFGIAAAGGAGKALAEWVESGGPTLDLWPVDIRRFGKHHGDRQWSKTRTLEAYAHHYTMAWPHEEFETGRLLRTSPLYERLKSSGACFGSKMGWERPNWFAPPGVEPKDVHTFERPNWFEHVGEEHRAARESVALFDESSFAKFLVRGADAEQALSWICSNDVSHPPGRVVYTQMLNQRGGVECDLTVSRLADDTFYIVTGTGYATHDFDWIGRNLPDGSNVELEDVTEEWAVLGLMGPRAREVLASVTKSDVSNDAISFGQCCEISMAGAQVRAFRLTFVGELGWELHIPVSSAADVYDALMESGAEHGIRNAGYRAIESLRLEKGYRVWSRDVTPDDTPLEAGLGWAVKLNTDIDFQGRAALLERQREGKLSKRFAQFIVADPEVDLLGRETIYRNGERVGWLSSGGFGHTLGRSVGLGYVRHAAGVDREFLSTGTYELEVAGERVPCSLSLRPAYDPDMVRVRA